MVLQIEKDCDKLNSDFRRWFRIKAVTSSMTRHRYIKDYRLIEFIDEKGRIRSDYEYIGADYRFRADGGRVKAAKRRVTAALILGWCCFLGALFPVSAAMHTFYVSFPYIFSAIPLGILADIALTTFRRKEPLEHRHADRLSNRLPAAALAAAILAGVSLAGEGIAVIAGPNRPVTGDLIFSVCAAAVCAAGVLVFTVRHALETEAK